MREPGEIRRREDGTFEYLRTVAMSIRQGYVEQWESAAEHAAKNMTMPVPFLAALHEAGYKGGHTLFDLLIAEGWRRPNRDYVELSPPPPPEPRVRKPPAIER